MKPFHRIESINRDFSREEWLQWCDSHHYREAVSESSGFQWNSCDVCINPNRPVYFRDKHHFIEVTTAQSPCGAWTYGLSCWIGTQGCGCGAHYAADPSKGYPTEKAAIVAALTELQDRARHALGEADRCEDSDDDCDPSERFCVNRPSARKVVNHLNRLMEFYNPSQPTLFD